MSNKRELIPASVAMMAVLVLGSISGQTIAQSNSVDLNKFELADTDGNGCVSWEELRNRAMVFFASLDIDEDGIVTVNEHLAAIGADTMDEDGEAMPVKVIDPGRFQAAMRESFNLADENEDACLDEKEWADQ